MFDAQVVLSPKSTPRGELLSRYVRARITRMDGIDIGLYDFDRHNAIYFFILNEDEQIYLRYGGRDSESALSYLDLDSLDLALELGLEQHELHRQGKHERQPRPEPWFPRQITSLKRREMDRGRCVECHLIGDYEAQDLEAAGELDKLRQMFRSPDIKTLGIHLDIPKGLVVAKAEGPVAAAGMAAGDRISAIEGVAVLTFGDLQYRYDQLPRDREQVSLTVQRGDVAKDLVVVLPPEWWWTDLYYRFWSVEPVLHFSADLLTVGEKRAMDLRTDGFACRVRFVEAKAAALDLHHLHVGDVIYAADGVDADPDTSHCEIHLKLRHRAGSTVLLDVLREGERIGISLTSQRQYFRKQEPRSGAG